MLSLALPLTLVWQTSNREYQAALSQDYTDGRDGRAKRRRLRELHPDRFPGDPSATRRFADFQALCLQTVKDEETRKTYDNITTAEELEGLNRRLLGVSLE